MRPSPLEASLRIIPFQGSVQQHHLTSYLDSIVAVLMSQAFKTSKSGNTMAKIVEIVQPNKPLKVSNNKEHLGILCRQVVLGWRIALCIALCNACTAFWIITAIAHISTCNSHFYSCLAAALECLTINPSSEYWAPQRCQFWRVLAFYHMTTARRHNFMVFWMEENRCILKLGKAMHDNFKRRLG